MVSRDDITQDSARAALFIVSFPYQSCTALIQTSITGSAALVQRSRACTAGADSPQSMGNTCCNCWRSEEHTSELQSRPHLVCRLLLEKKKKKKKKITKNRKIELL